MNVLFFVPHSKNAAGARYRVHQFIPFLEASGVRCELREFVNPELYRVLYSSSNKLEKAYRIGLQSVRRFFDVRDAKGYDAFFVYRECFPFGPAFIEEHLRKLGRPIIYDFDDAIFLPEPTRLRDALRNPAKTSRIVQLADAVVVSNEHLRGYAAAYNKNVHVIPTSVDTDFFAPGPPREHADGAPIRLGWIGSHSTAKYLEQLRPVLSELAQRYAIELMVVGAGRDFEAPGVTVLNRKWSLEGELALFQSLDIGLYPLGDTVWELGKAGFKAIQYMSVGVPAVVSRVGVASDIVRDGENGFLVSSRAEWVERLAQLIESAELRRRLGAAGRQTILQGYSLTVNAPRLLATINQAMKAAS
jgi:glycosyltransferase involved in cell wall biosynthesis